MRVSLILAALLTVAACGANGPPEKPAPEPGISITGDLTVGVSAKIN